MIFPQKGSWTHFAYKTPQKNLTKNIQKQNTHTLQLVKLTERF